MIDSEAALDALIKGHSRTEDVCELVTVFWQLVARHRITIYLDKVATDSNIADGLSRFKLQEFKDAGWDLDGADVNALVGPASEFEVYRKAED